MAAGESDHIFLRVDGEILHFGATVLDILGGDNYIGLGRSSLSGQSLSGIFMNMKEKVLAWKPDVIPPGSPAAVYRRAGRRTDCCDRAC